MRKFFKIKELNIFDWVKIGLVILLLLCLLPMSYGSYTLLKFIAMVGFGSLCYDYWQKSLKPLAVVFGSLALLFQPFAKISLGRSVWIWVDILVAVLLISLLLIGFILRSQKSK